jgi:hypothetical protein
MAQQSLADVAVSTLAAINVMADGISTDDPERHAVWALKRAAEQAVLNGLQTAGDIVRAARDAREAVADAKKEAAEK